MSPDEPDKPPAEEGVAKPEPASDSGTVTEASNSGSIEVVFSAATKLPARETTTGVPVAVPTDLDTSPVSSGRVRAVAAGDASGRSRRMKAAVQDAVSGSVEKLGSGVELIGEGVSKLGDATRKVPLVGSSVSKIGEGISQVGEVMGELPRAARTRRGRLLLRSIVVGFALVFGWIAVIVGLQLHGNDSPDFRPDAERILIQLAQGSAAIADVYEQASPRFQEITRKDAFVTTMTDMNATVGKFREVTAINDTLVTTGPTGRIGRVSLTAAFASATCHGSVSFHYDQGTWKFLGISIELPPELTISQRARDDRVQACKDPMDARTCDLHFVANRILSELRDDQAGKVYDEATEVFRDQVKRDKFIQIQNEHRAAIGKYQRIIKVTEAKEIGGVSATFELIAQYERFEGVRSAFTFVRNTNVGDWKLGSYKVVVPVPRAADEPKPPKPGEGSAVHPAPRDAGIK